MQMFLIAGGVRTGTTMLADWLPKAWPEAFATKESAILRCADWWISSARFTPRLTDFKSTCVNHVKSLVDSLYREIGWDGISPVLDKETYVFSDLDFTWEHLNLLFGENLTTIWTIREPVAVINSMQNRSWGDTRGSVLNPQVSAMWSRKDVHNSMSPMAHRLSKLENQVGDLFAENGTREIWSLRKCCEHFRNSTMAANMIRPSDSTLILDYDRLDQTPYRQFVESWIGRAIGRSISVPIPFSRRSRHTPMNAMEEAELHERLGVDTQDRHRELVEMANVQFKGGSKALMAENVSLGT